MNALRAAAWLALVVTVIAIGYLCYALYDNEISLASVNQNEDCLELKMRYGENYPCKTANPALEYGVSGGIAVVGLIASLALFGAEKSKSEAKA
jgi:hypothetical protein